MLLSTIILLGVDIQKIVNHSFGIGDEVSAPILMSFIVFFLGILFQSIYKIIIKEFNRSRTRKMFLEILKCTVEDLDLSQSVSLDLTKTLTVSNHKADWGFILAPIRYLETFKTLQLDNIYSSFFRLITFKNNNKVIAFHSLWLIFSKLDYLNLNFEKKGVELIDKYNKYKNNYEEAFELYLETRDAIVSKYNGTKIDFELNTFIQALDSKFNNWLKLDETERMAMDISFNEIFLPSHELIQNESGFTKELGMEKPIMKALYAYENIKFLLESYNLMFSNDYKVYKSSQKKIKDAISILS